MMSYDVIFCRRYKVTVEVPLQQALFRMLPNPLQEGQEITVCTVLFTQGINEQQLLADRWETATKQLFLDSKLKIVQWDASWAHLCGNW